MTFIEITMAIIAASILAIGLSVVVLVRRVLPVIRRTNTLLRRTSATMTRVESVATDLEHVSRDARILEHRVATSVHGLLDQVEPGMRILTGVLAGARSGVGAMFRKKEADHLPSPPQETSNER